MHAEKFEIGKRSYIILKGGNLGTKLPIDFAGMIFPQWLLGLISIVSVGECLRLVFQSIVYLTRSLRDQLVTDYITKCSG